MHNTHKTQDIRGNFSEIYLKIVSSKSFCFSNLLLIAAGNLFLQVRFLQPCFASTKFWFFSRVQNLGKTTTFQLHKVTIFRLKSFVCLDQRTLGSVSWVGKYVHRPVWYGLQAKSKIVYSYHSFVFFFIVFGRIHEIRLVSHLRNLTL